MWDCFVHIGDGMCPTQLVRDLVGELVGTEDHSSKAVPGGICDCHCLAVESLTPAQMEAAWFLTPKKA
jgi:hypothetical protein